MPLRTRCSSLRQAILAGCIASVISGTAFAETTYQFDLPPQQLGDALKTLGRITNSQFLFSDEIIANLRSTAIAGKLSASQALEQLLKDTPLYAEQTKSGVFLIRLKAQPQVSAPAGTARVSPEAASKKGAPDTPRMRRDNRTGDVADSAVASRESGPATGFGGVPAIAEVIVTGTRLAIAGSSQPTQVTMISADELAAVAPEGNYRAMVELPNFSGSNSPTNGGVAANAGHTYLNLRGLGIERNLVLLDGRRFVPTSDSGAPDINLFPQLLLKRVEIVTGGASAAYGSDALAGVTNFILDDQFTGFKSLLSTGQTTYGDGQTTRLSLAGGSSFLDDRLHVLGSIDYTDSRGIYGYAIGPHGYVTHGPTREWEAASHYLITDPENPERLMPGRDARFADSTIGGLISTGPLAGTRFLPGGVPAPYDPGSNHTQSYQTGGDGVTPAGGANIQTPLIGRVVFLRGSLDVTNRLQLFAQGNWGKTNIAMRAGPSYGYGVNAYTIFRDNAFLPTSIAAAMDEIGIMEFQMGRWNTDLGLYTKTVESRTAQGVVGLKGGFGSHWSWDAYYQHGQSHGTFRGENGLSVTRIYNAVDAVVDDQTGDIVCRTALTNPASGCVPLNLFGSGSPSSEAIAYVMGVPWAIQKVREDVAAVNLRGAAFPGPSGPIQLAVGAEYRREAVTQVVSPEAVMTVSGRDAITGGVAIRGFPESRIGTPGDFFLGNSNPVDGAYDVQEIYAETSVPLVANQPWARALDASGAIRYTKYSSVGDITTWKAGLSWSPVQDLRLRGTISRDVRAPNIGELYLSQAATIQTVIDPLRGGAGTTVTVTLPGDPDLVAERARTYTYGLVYQPRQLPTFSATLDIYRISIDNAVGRLTSQQTVDQCVGGNATLCQSVVRTPGGDISLVATPARNLMEMQVSGLDAEINYTTNLARWAHWLRGDLHLRALATHVDKRTNAPLGSPMIDYANTFPTAVNLRIGYRHGRWDGFVRQRYLGRRAIDSTYTSARIADNSIPAISYTDVSLACTSVAGLDGLEIFATVNNVFDRAPPTGVITLGTQGIPTFFGVYDVVGRMYTLGIRYQR